MFFNGDHDTFECQQCGYKIYKPTKTTCPKCGSPLISKEKSSSAGKKGSHRTNGKKDSQNQSTLSFIKNLKVTNDPNIVQSSIGNSHKKTHNSQFSQNYNDDTPFNQEDNSKQTIGNIKISKASVDESLAVVKKIQKVTQFQIDREKIPLGKSKAEYIKYVGLTTRDRDEVFSLNETFKYLLDLAVNLEYISTSILSGELDKMFLQSPENQEEEICYFSIQKEIIFVVYGKIPEKKANWLINQLKMSTKDYISSGSISSLSKYEKYFISQKYRKKVPYLLETILDLQDVFSANIVNSLDANLRIDYFGLSYQSIGIISKLVTNQLDIQDLPKAPESGLAEFEDRNEIKEALITAKIEAIAANTFANTLMQPKWISVKLGYQRYRFMLFLKIHDYYATFLTEGNLEKRNIIFAQIEPILDPLTIKPFLGILNEYTDLAPVLVRTLKDLNRVDE
ncbi:MAG: FmdB family zinc ribbon protein [Promethearchaeota archaeon]